jgi:hypothetical protein
MIIKCTAQVPVQMCTRARTSIGTLFRHRLQLQLILIILISNFFFFTLQLFTLFLFNILINIVMTAGYRFSISNHSPGQHKYNK